MKAALIACALACLLPAAARAQAMEFQLAATGEDCERCRWIAAEGEIIETTLPDFENFLAANPTAGPLVAFHSPGGGVIDGMRLGSLIRSRGFWTTVGETVDDPGKPGKQRLDPGMCASACSYTFMGGVRRFAEEGEVGVHQFYFEDDGSKVPEETPAVENQDPETYKTSDVGISQTIMGAVLAYLIKMGASPEILAIATNMTPESMHFFTAEELVSLRITTEDDPARDWSLALAGDGIEARASTDRPWLARTDISVFCENGRTLLAYDFAFYGPPGQVAADIAQNVGAIGFRLPDAEIAPKLENFAFDGERSALRLLFSLDEATFERLAGASEIAADLEKLPRAARGSFGVFHAKLSGDPKAPKLALRNCVG